MSALPTILLLVGLVGIYIGERIGGSPAIRYVFDGLGVLLLLGSGFLRLRPAASGPKAPAEARRWGQMLFFGVLVGLALYALSLPEIFDRFGLEGDTEKAFAAILAVAWAIVTFVSVIALVFVDSSLLWNRQAPSVELARVRGAASSGLAIGLMLAIFGLVNYAANVKRFDKDLSLQKVGQPSDATVTIAQTLEEPMYVSSFFPPANEVFDQIDPYLRRLEQEGEGKLVVLTYDHAFAPKVAERLRVTDNGSVVFSKRDPREEQQQAEGVKDHPKVTIPNDKLRLGIDLRRAQTNLKKFDSEVQKRLLKTARGDKRVYFTVGHGERDYRGTPRDQEDKRGRLRILNALLKSQAMQIRSIGAADGLLSDVPPGTGAVVIAGPTEAFLEVEEDTLIRYFDNGGRLFIFLDPNGKAPDKLLAHLGVVWDPTVVVNTRRNAHLPLERAPKDRARLITKRYSSHPSVTGLARSSEPMGLPFTGSLAKAADTKLNVQLTVKSASGSFKDPNGNFIMDRENEEKVEQLNFVAAVEGQKVDDKQGRAIIVGSTDVIADFWMRFKGNQSFSGNGFHWLVGDDETAVAVTEIPGEDVPVIHSAGKTALIFYSTVFGVPGLVLLAGFFLTRPQRRQRRRLE